MNFKNVVYFFLIGLAMVLFNLVAHEGGHVIVSSHYGAEVYSVQILGLEVYPSIEFQGLQKYLGKVRFIGLLDSNETGQVLLMGAGTTWFLSVLFLVILYTTRTIIYDNFKFQTVLLFGSLMFLDFVTYSFGLRLTGINEPMRAANYLHIPWSLMLAMVIILGFIQFLVVLRYIAINRYWRFFLKNPSTDYQS